MKPLPRLDELDTLSRARRLDPHEESELQRLITIEYQRRRRLPGRIERKRAELLELIGQLPPADRLREFRSEVRQSWDRLRTLEEALEPGAHLSRILKEISQ